MIQSRAHLELGREPVVHAEHPRVPQEIEIVADHVLIVRHKKTVTVDRIRRKDRSVVESIGFAVEPVALRLIVVDLVLDRDVLERRPFESAAQPKFLGAGSVVGDVVIGRQRRDSIVIGPRLLPENVLNALPETTPLTA